MTARGQFEVWKRMRAELLATYQELHGDNEALIDTLEGETNITPERIVNAMVEEIRNIETLALALGERVAVMNTRKRRLEGTIETMRTALLQVMDLGEITKSVQPEFTVSRRRVAPKVLVTEESEIPSEFFKPQAPKLDKTALKKALDSGRDVSGAIMSNASETVSIKYT